MNIALVGFGKMGHEIAHIVEQKKTHKIVSLSYSDTLKKIDTNSIAKADVVIEFTSPEIVIENIRQLAKLQKPIVVGTTGWYDHLELVREIITKHNIGLIYGQNFSVGANIFFEIIRFSSSLFNSLDSYDVYGFEVHHNAKKDSPSGTSKRIAQEVLSGFKKKKTLQTEKLDRQIQPEEFHFASIRGGVNPGRHEVIFDSYTDAISLVHQAHNRSGFAEGALLAAEYIRDKKGLYKFEDEFEHML